MNIRRPLLSQLLCAGLLVNAAACADEGSDSGSDAGADVPADVGAADCDDAPATLVVDEDITVDTTWCAATDVRLEALTFVSGATLTIEPGTTISGENGAALVVASDARIEAAGTADAPIVFTSGFGDQGEPGDWGGLVLLGNATVNVGSSNIEGMEASDLSSYGGSDDAHDCGTLRYVRIEYAGYVFGEDNELNGLTVGGCGSGTTLEYIQVHKGLDDGIEFFGGTTSIRWALVTQTGDDSVDWDEGWRGNAQFLAIQQSSSTGDRGFESDNLGDDNGATPRSNPTVFNVTMVSPGSNDEQLGIKLRRGTGVTLGNVIIAGFDGGSIDIDSEESASLWGGNLTMTHVLSFANGEFPEETGDDDDDRGFDEATELPATAGWSTEDPLMADWESLTAPNLVPAAESPAAVGTDAPGSWFEDAPYYGAFEPGGNDWTAGWTAFP